MRTKDNKKLFAFIVSLLICVLIFSVFIGQVLWSDVLTFHKSGDDLRICFPAVKKIAKYLKEGVYKGVDINSFNGATEFFSRANLPHHYILAVLAGYLTNFFPGRGIYLAFYFIHLFLCSYFSIRLAQRFFRMKNQSAFLFACSWITVALYEYWYLSFYLVTTLLPIMLYFEFMLFEAEHFKWKECVLFSFPYVLSITSGYITLSVAMAVSVFAAAFAYGFLFKKENGKKVFIRTIVPFAVGMAVCFLFCIQLYIYQKKVSRPSMTMSDALSLKLNFQDLIRIISGAFISENAIEQMQVITIGMFWIFILVLAGCFHLLKKKREQKFVFWGGVGLNVFFVMIALGTVVPFAVWFYAMVPIFGSMHLPLRYLMVTLLFFYIGVSMLIDEIPDLRQNRYIKLSAAGMLLLGFSGLLAAPYLTDVKVNMEKLLIELFFMAFILIFTCHYGLRHTATVILSGFFILLPGVTSFYDANEVSINESAIRERSIVYDTAKQEQLDAFISGLDRKDRYMYAAFDSTEYLPVFFPGNYGWYGYSRYYLSNYSGYEHHMAVAKEYRDHFPWFDVMDWNYIADTRGDFIVTDQESVEERMDVLDQMTDWEESSGYLDGTHRILKLKKFVPSYYTGKNFVEDRAGTMDNGFFYCPDLKKEDLSDFCTDYATYFHASVNASKKCEVAFLLYPDRNYHYYVNGKETEPVIYHMQAFIPVGEGKNSIQVVYEDQLADMKNTVFLVYYAAVLICAACSAAGHWKGKNRNNLPEK